SAGTEAIRLPEATSITLTCSLDLGFLGHSFSRIRARKCSSSIVSSNTARYRPLLERAPTDGKGGSTLMVVRVVPVSRSITSYSCFESSYLRKVEFLPTSNHESFARKNRASSKVCQRSDSLCQRIPWLSKSMNGPRSLNSSAFELGDQDA